MDNKKIASLLLSLALLAGVWGPLRAAGPWDRDTVISSPLDNRYIKFSTVQPSSTTATQVFAAGIRASFSVINVSTNATTPIVWLATSAVTVPAGAAAVHYGNVLGVPVRPCSYTSATLSNISMDDCTFSLPGVAYQGPLYAIGTSTGAWLKVIEVFPDQ